jgi:glycosyltransferase involved in cell wall biosynthesis
MLSHKVREEVDLLAEQFSQAVPFRHVCIDGFFDDAIAGRMLEEFPSFAAEKAINEHGEVGLKAVHENLSDISPFYREVARYLSSPEFSSFMGRLTRIDGLIWGGESIYRGGTHENLEGIDLDPHLDFNYDDRNELHRRLNVLVYLNRDWEESWGGQLELHSDPREPTRNYVKTFLPKFNRCVIFETNEHCWHAFPRINLPSDKKHPSRKSLAIYLYTKERPREEVIGGHTTLHAQSPLPDTVRPGEVLSIENYQLIQHLIYKRDVFTKLYQDMQIRSGEERAALLHQLEHEQSEKQILAGQARQLVHLTAERDRLNQEIKQFQATVRGQQQALDAKGNELVQLQAAAQAYEQELAAIKDTIGWKVLNRYCEIRQKSAVLRYLHFFLTEPVKRVSKNKTATRHEANDLTSPSDLSPDLTSPSDLSPDARLRCPSTGARSVLILGPWLPAMDRAAGGLRAFSILQILREEGYIVVFGADREKLEHVWLFGSEQEVNQYEMMFERLNIEVLYGSKAVLRHLHEKGYEYQFVVLSYPEVAYRYLSHVRAYAINAKVVYDPVDLHWLRMKRESGIKDDDVLRQQSENYRQMERFNAAAADIVFAVTQEEKSQILEEVKNAKVEVIPTIHDYVDEVKPLAGRQNLLFVGHYAHSPNEDAVCYFVKEILPLIRQDIPGVVFYMVGSHITETVQSLASPDVIAVGYAPDLTPYLDGCRVFVAPLRYGAGIKGKIGQSMAFGLPVVTTSLGAEGMNLIDGEHVLIADSPAAFARAVVRLYTDDLLWEDMSQNALLHIKSSFSKAVVQAKLAQIFATEFDGVRSSIAEVG